jgi:hypothetical protein
MQALPRDGRGYPIPAVVYRDTSGHAHFTVNDDRLVDQALREDRCPTCWGRLTRGRWFVGGPMSALHPDGVFADPPMHRACAIYALRVCPYMAAPRYARSREAAVALQAAGLTHGIQAGGDGQRPDLFVLAMATGQSVSDRIPPVVRPRKPYRQIEYWRAGVRIPDCEGQALVATILRERTARPAQPVLVEAPRG